jgi:hypothetical protein
VTSPGQEPPPDPDANAPIVFEHDMPDGSVYREPMQPPRPRISDYNDARAVSPTLQERARKEADSWAEYRIGDLLDELVARIDSLEAQLARFARCPLDMEASSEFCSAGVCSEKGCMAARERRIRGLVATAHRIVRELGDQYAGTDIPPAFNPKPEMVLREVQWWFAAAGITEPEEPTGSPECTICAHPGLSCPHHQRQQVAEPEENTDGWEGGCES